MNVLNWSRLANGANSEHTPRFATASRQEMTALASPPSTRLRVATPPTPPISPAEERSEDYISSATVASSSQPRAGHTKQWSRRHEIESLSAWMDDFKFDLKVHC